MGMCKLLITLLFLGWLVVYQCVRHLLSSGLNMENDSYTLHNKER